MRSLGASFLLLFGLTMVACEQFSSAPKQPSETDPIELKRKLDYLNNRVNKLESSLDKLSRSVEELDKTNRQNKADQSVVIEDLRTELKSLQGNMDVIRHDTTDATEANKKFKEDFDTRLNDIENRPRAAPALAPAPKGGGSKNAGVDDITRYNQILRVILDKKDYDTAITQFDDFLRTYPSSSLASNAQYWIGEGYFAKGEYKRAINEFQKVTDQYPKSEKVCASVLKQGIAFLELKDIESAKLFLTDVTKRCPKTKEATQARTRLRELAGAPTKK